MAPATRSQLKTPEGALTHVLNNVLIVGEDAPIRKALAAAQTANVVDFMELSRQDLTELTYGTPPTRLSITDRNKLIAIQRWFRDQETPTIDTWFELSADGFQAFRERTMSSHGSHSSYLSTVAADANASVAASEATSPERLIPSFEELFLKGTKRGVTDYKAFKELKQWNVWNRHLLATATAHGISNVFDSKYVPVTSADKSTFKMAQVFAFSVLTTHIQEPSAQAAVRKYSIPGTPE